MDNKWSEYVQTSEELYRSRALRFHDQNKDLWLQMLRVQDEMNVLEVGCGGGLFCHRIKKYLPHTSVTGLDFDSGHIDYAKAKSKELGLDCSFVNGDAIKMPFPDDSFDLCYSYTVMEHIEPNAFLREHYRVLKPGGTIAALTVLPGLNLDPENWRPDDGEENELLTKAFEAVSGDGPLRIRQYPLTATEFAPIMEKHGFHNINVQVFSVISYAPDNADISDETAIESINLNRLFALNSVEKALKLKPNALTKSEYYRLTDLINRRFDDRLHKYKHGEKLWDISTCNVIAITGMKR